MSSFRQRLARLLPVIETQRLVADDLVGLVPLAGHQHNIARLGARYSKSNRLAAIQNALVIALDTGGYRVRDLGGILGAWVVVGDNNCVGSGLGCPPHQLSLSSVTVATSPKNTP